MPQTDNWIPFYDNLQKKIGSKLSELGFQLDSSRIGEIETTIAYKRLHANSDQIEMIEFDGVLWTDFVSDEKNTFNWLRVYATCRNVTLVVRQLSPNLGNNPEATGGYELEGWIYINEVDLNAALDEINEIVSTRLLEWFENPTIGSSTQ